MAFENVNNAGTIVKAREIKVGDSVTGYVTAIVEGQFGPNVKLQMEDGSSVTLLSAGNIRYAISDGKIRVGLLTRFTRNADKLVKGKTSTNFTIEQDATKRLQEVSELDVALADNNISALATKTSPAANAAKLAKQVNKG
jgi:hypothetical protein